jgi:AAA+ superfamily predicted ATPase
MPVRHVDVEELPSDLQDVYRELLMPVKTEIDFDSVILSRENREKVEEFMLERRKLKQLQEYGLLPMRRLLFFGASGFGKTYLAKALSCHMSFTMLYVDIAQSLSEGRVAKNISDIFRLGNHIKQCFIFFDEVDSIAWDRDTTKGDSADMRRATNSIFQQIDQMDETNVFIAATNMIHRLDSAFNRRFDMRFEFKQEYIGIIEAVRKFLFKKFRLYNDMNIHGIEVMQRCLNISYAEIREITERHMKRAILRDSDFVKLSDVFFDMAIAMRITINVEGNMVDKGEYLTPLV